MPLVAFFSGSKCLEPLPPLGYLYAMCFEHISLYPQLVHVLGYLYAGCFEHIRLYPQLVHVLGYLYAGCFEHISAGPGR